MNNLRTEKKIYDEAYKLGEDLWDKVKHKRIHNIIFSDIESKLKELRVENCKGTVLNIGCGTGRNIPYLADLSQNLINIDISDTAVKKAREIYKFNNCTFKVMDANNLDFAEESFDYIEGIAILHHLNHEKVIRQIYRILKPGGIATFLEPGLLNPPAIFARKFMRTSFHTPDEHPFIPSNLKKLTEQLGFESRVYGFNILSYGLSYSLPDNVFTVLLLKLTRFFERIIELTFLKNLSGNFIITIKRPN